MYIEHGIGLVITLLPVLLFVVLVAGIIVLYRHPTKLQKRWYKISLKKRKRVKQFFVFLGFVAIFAMLLYPQLHTKKMKSEVELSAKQLHTPTVKKLHASLKDSHTEEYIPAKKIKNLYKILSSDEDIMQQSQISSNESVDFDSTNFGIDNDQTGEYEIRVFAESAALNRMSVEAQENYYEYEEGKFYKIIRNKDKTFSENYQNLSEEQKQKITNLEWHYKKGVLYAADGNKKLQNGSAQYFMKDTKVIKDLDKSGYKGIRQWMEQCEKDKKGLRVKVGNKTYLLHNADQWHKFEKNGITFLYNYKRFIIRFNINKEIGIKNNTTDLPQTGREVWTVMADHSGVASNEVILRSNKDDDVYGKKHIQIFLKDHKIKQMLIYWDGDVLIDSDEPKVFSKAEKTFIKACFEKMGISSDEAAKWLDTFMIGRTKESGKIGDWNYEQGDSRQAISYNITSEKNYVNFYKKSKGNN